ncbi:hypothetical protein GHT06_009350 [Daphnia sinensis]|uniref:Zinc finger protein 865 n=1 Tax=Daphnia sinensis TaxID=1820382 RepID=A0AAD5Q1F4_9CRUS|nr:hypothetical protein GHT06_009350 [Daphnia sinensis]
MGNCEGLEILGVLTTTQESKQMVLQLKPGIEIPWESCGFCDYKLDSQADEQQLRETEHSHSIKGIFSFIPSKNQWTLTFSACDKEEKHQNATKHATTYEVLKNDTDTLHKKLQLQYEVDGKVYELQSSYPTKKSRNGETSNIFPSLNKAVTQPTKAIEFVIENRKFSTKSSISSITPTLEGPVNNIEEERSALEASAELLQVKLIEKCIIPDRIGCGPDTSTFLQNMRELAKLVTPSGQNPFTCDQCGDEMTSYFPYIEHVFKHFGSRPYVCNVCQATFQTRAVMRHHLDMHGGKAPFECEFCGKKFRNSCHMKQHRMRHTGERPHNCPYCEKTFAHKNVLKIHLQVHTGEKPCCCDLCGKLFREPHRLACHLATHYRSSKSLDCSTCGKSFKTSGMLKLHETKRCNNKVQTALERATESLETLQNVTYIENMDESHFLDTDHEVTIIEAESLEVLPVNTYIVEPSELCRLQKYYIEEMESDKFGMVCEVLSSTAGHETTEYGKTQESCHDVTKMSTITEDLPNSGLTGCDRHVCNECGANFISLLKYMDHLNRHTGNKPYVCEECNKQFFTLSYLRNHQKLHSADYQFICEFCGKAFRLKNNLQMHELTHTKEKPFKCDLCDKAYTHPMNLKIHKQEHTGAKPFQCETCGRCFRTTHRLKTHKMSHTGEKAFSCLNCEAKFTSNSKVKRHMSLHCKLSKAAKFQNDEDN